MAQQAGQSQKAFQAVLEFISGPNPTQMVKLRRDATILGREKGDIIIDDREISSTHCQIQIIDGHHHIFDMNSTNGTYVNNQKVVKQQLNANDLISIGTTSFRFLLKEDREAKGIPTVFSSRKEAGHQPLSVVDTLIESELRSTSNLNTLVIEVEYRDGSHEEITFKQRVVYIGRASSFGHFDQDPEISRKHLLIKLNDNGEVFIEDQGSTNGSRLNGQRISGMHLVQPRDAVKVGGTTMKILAKAT